MRTRKPDHSWFRLALIFLIAMLALGLSLPAAAQESDEQPAADEASATEEIVVVESQSEDTPTDEPTEAPTEAPTDEPTEAPTEVPTEAPTEVVTTEAPTEVPTEVVTTEAPTEVVTTEAPTEVPTDLVTTEAPTDVPTDETATDVPTDETATDVPTDATATDAPTDAPTDVVPTEGTEEVVPTEVPTVEITETPEVVAQPPVFVGDTSAVFDVQAGGTLTLQFIVSDDEAGTSISADTTATAGKVEVNVSTDDSDGAFNTFVSVDYSAAADYAGGDTFLLTATDSDDLTISALIVLNVLPAPIPTVTPEPTLEATDIPLEDYEQLIVNIDPDASDADIQEVLDSLDAVEVDRIPEIGGLIVLVPPEVSEPEVAEDVLEDDGAADAAGVESVEENGAYPLLFEPNDPNYLTDQANLGYNATHATGSIDVARAWNIATNRGSGVVVAVLDTGIQMTNAGVPNHEDLPASQVDTANMWDFFDDDAVPRDTVGHGTRVASIIAAAGNNNKRIAGVAYNARVMPIRVCAGISDNLNVTPQVYGCPFGLVAAGIVHAVDHGAKVINLSFGSSDPAAESDLVKGAIDYALSRNVVVIAAAGNTGNGDLVYPAAFPGVISVGAHDTTTGVIRPFSTTNSEVDFTAPGEDIPALTISNGFTANNDGTSFAAAHVSGIAALLISQGVATRPATIQDALICGATNPNVPGGHDNIYGWGRVSAYFSMNWNGNSTDCHQTVTNDTLTRATNIASVPFQQYVDVHAQNVTEDNLDPNICGAAREQTLWYKFNPSSGGYYAVDTYGSTYTNTVIGVFQGSGSELTEVECVVGQHLVAPLVNGITYYIVVASTSEVDDQTLRVGVVGSITAANTNIEENATSISYNGTWARTALSGASGGNVMQTTDTSAGFSFAFRGNQFTLYRTVGPGRGVYDVYINGTLMTTLNNEGGVVQIGMPFSRTIAGADPGQWNFVHFQRQTGTPGLMDIDRIRVRDYDGTGTDNVIGTTKVNDSTSNTFVYRVAGDWSNISVATNQNAMSNQVRFTNTTGSTVSFRVTGNTIRIWRGTGSGFRPMTVTVDDGDPISIANNVGSSQVRAVTLVGFANMQHVVTITVGSPGTKFWFDAAQGLNLTTLPVNTAVDDRDTRLSFNGVTTTQNNVTGAFQQTTRTFNNKTEAVFTFRNDDLCIGYQQKSGLGSIRLEIDNQPIDMDGVDGSGALNPAGTDWPTAGSTSFRRWCLQADGDQVLANTLHVASVSATGGQIILDYFRVQNYQILTASRGIVNETDAAFIYGNINRWETRSGAAAESDGGYAPKGGAYRYVDDLNDQHTKITFFINGTGFVLYTQTSGNTACWNVQIDDNAPENFRLAFGTTTSPIGYAFTDLEPGIHRVVLEADVLCDDYSGSVPPSFLGSLVFDAVRVFP